MKSALCGAMLGLAAVVTAVGIAHYRATLVQGRRDFAATWEILKSPDGKSTTAWKVTMTEKEFLAFANYSTDEVSIDRATHDRINKAIRAMVEGSGLAGQCSITYDLFLRDPRVSIMFVGLCHASKGNSA